MSAGCIAGKQRLAGRRPGIQKNLKKVRPLGRADAPKDAPLLQGRVDGALARAAAHGPDVTPKLRFYALRRVTGRTQ